MVWRKKTNVYHYYGVVSTTRKRQHTSNRATTTEDHRRYPETGFGEKDGFLFFFYTYVEENKNKYR